MTWRVVTVGKPKLPYAAAGAALYESRIRHFAKFERRVVPASDRDRESAALLDLSEGGYRLLLDSRGIEQTSRLFAEILNGWLTGGRRTVCLLVGGADGVNDAVRRASDQIWSLGQQTLAHELALVVALEQIYRAHTILAGLPYHRE